MKTFDLTFSGSILPSYDPEQVRLDLARLFVIEDHALLEKVFSGTTVVLRSDLDRKTAANLYQQVTQLGIRVELVTSDERVANVDRAAIRLDAEAPKMEADTVKESVALTATQISTKAATPAPTLISAPVSTTAANNSGSEDDRKELRRLRALIDKTQQQAQAEAIRLERTLEKFDHIAEQELARLKVLGESAEADMQQKQQQLKSQERQAHREINDTLEALGTKETQFGADLEDMLEALATQQRQAREKENTECQQLRQSIAEKHRCLEKDIERMQMLIDEAKTQHQVDVAELKQQIENVHDNTREEITVLEGKKGTVREGHQEKLKSLRREREQTERKPVLASADFEQQLSTATQLKQQEEIRLQAMMKEIRDKRNEGIHRTRESLAQVQKSKEMAVQRLQHREKEVLQRLSEERTSESSNTVEPLTLKG